MKYNVTNCPAFDKEQQECSSFDTDRLCCWMNEDCIMKQIVNRYRYQQSISDLLEIEEME